MNVYVSQAKERQKDGGLLESLAVFNTPMNLVYYWRKRFNLDVTDDEMHRHSRTLGEEGFLMLRGGANRDVELVANEVKVDAWYERSTQ
jgi:hypothetical protein